MAARLVIGLGLTLLTLILAGQRMRWLYALIHSGQPDHGRTEDLGDRLRTQLTEVFGQRRLLKWMRPFFSLGSPEAATFLRPDSRPPRIGAGPRAANFSSSSLLSLPSPSVSSRLNSASVRSCESARGQPG